MNVTRAFVPQCLEIPIVYEAYGDPDRESSSFDPTFTLRSADSIAGPNGKKVHPDLT